ncbi:MAG: hypothetical protein K1X53_09875 [Candidatus Sumerlaeaceae bacterium]|nr:hypothetical protein [Candidatus Sumerlaeaceae bacterium]
MTLAQIVQRQDENYRRIKSASGDVFWREENYGTTQTAIAPVRALFFAFEDDRSVNLIVPHKLDAPFPRREPPKDWRKALSAVLVDGEAVYSISQKAGAVKPVVSVAPFNPAVHQNNPLVAFHPRLLGDERVRLGDLLALSSQMPTRPRVTQFQKQNELLLRVDFANTSSPGEMLTYIINPNKGYLPQEIARVSGGRIVARTLIIIGKTKDGTWVPARREKTTYDATGKPLTFESWYYWSLAVNEPLGRQEVSMLFFHLPPDVAIPGVPVSSPPPSKAR